MSVRGSCRLKIPWPRWAVEQGDPRGEMEHENYKALERWADHLLSDCMGGCTGTLTTSITVTIADA